MASTDEVVVYTRRADGNSGVDVMSRGELDELLAGDASLQCATKPIARGQRHVEVLRKDLTADAAERAANAKFPNQNASLASVEVPARAYMLRLTLPAAFEVLYIVSWYLFVGSGAREDGVQEEVDEQCCWCLVLCADSCPRLCRRGLMRAPPQTAPTDTSTTPPTPTTRTTSKTPSPTNASTDEHNDDYHEDDDTGERWLKLV
ncbi:uncharacterized protein K452DRAFT_306824 [Aplosporella prunicola CBS 121167]|uniref:Uncharacterized protein n=1 Tax=Aplosporella prunicola CBS 121167 TaxID=1176127 RepID=A0A6A6BJ82_9PEZI|nr:uncharacterized protein K452DRAFT_306824 [Aplosporella prunicola CBS 121167]KAF2144220.1 hypothetical protein K452DRAFT_306824 [Aplosporella prunicola CBS 121167]